MSIQIASLNSGSNGNCYYVGTQEDAVLIDAGLSCRETERRMQRLGLSWDRVRAVFISHEHNDHITGLTAIGRKYGLPIYMTRGTQQQLSVPLERVETRIFQAPFTEKAGSLSVTAFAKHHDAAEPVSFVVSANGFNIGVFTDLGHACKELTHYFRQCQAAILESNYCEEMLTNGTYPEALKRRIRGNKGHLSNDQALALFLSHRHPQLQHLILGHLSQHNNAMEKVEGLFTTHAAGTQITVASRYRETALIKLDATRGEIPLRVSGKHKMVQGKLF